MRRLFGAFSATLILAITLAVSLPTASGAEASASAAVKHRCKHKAKKHRPKASHRGKKRCRKKASGTPTVEGPGKTDKPSAPSGPPGRLLATELEISSTQLRLQLSRGSLAAGDTIVEQYNAGEDPHNLILERAGTVAFSYPTLDPGATQRQTVNLAHGTWTLYCSLLNHKDLGMRATLTVN
jgi:plastocyanin